MPDRMLLRLEPPYPQTSDLEIHPKSKAFMSCALVSAAAALSRVAFLTCSVASTVSSSCCELTRLWYNSCERVELVWASVRLA